jgi:hypothetical protein
MTAYGGIVEWRKIPDHPGYEISTHGEIRRALDTKPRANTWPGRRIATFDCKGVISVRLNNRNHVLGRLMLLTFVGPPPYPDSYPIHKDLNTRNNRIDNLRWSTPKDGSYRKYNAAKITQTDVDEIRMARKLPKPQRPTLAVLAARYGISLRQVHRIVHNQVWKT